MNGVGDAALAIFLICVLSLLSWYDVRERIIPNRIVLPAWGVVLAAQLLMHPQNSIEWAVGSLAAAGGFLVLALVYPGGLGMGDVKLAGLIGAALGYNVLAGLLIGTLLAATFAAAILLRNGLAARRTTIPYGPFLAAGAVAMLVL